MRRNKSSEDIASEPCAARGGDASGSACSTQQTFKRNFVLQKLVAVHIGGISNLVSRQFAYALK